MPNEFDQNHPKYEARRADWALVKDAFEGERVVKSREALYLPITSGMWQLGMGYDDAARKRPGQLIYDAYIKRAVFHDLVRTTADALVGVMVREPWAIELPEQLAYLKKSATARSESLDALVRRVLRNQLLYGRVGLLPDIRTATNEIYFVDYLPLDVINWDDTPEGDNPDRQLKMVTLCETENVRRGFELQWREEQRHRLLTIGGRSNASEQYTVEVERDGVIGEAVVPKLQGTALDFIPFTFINSNDLIPEPGEAPLLALARLAMTMYRGEADYRWSLFMNSQDTLVLTGVPNPGAANVSTVDPDGVVPTGAAESQTGSKIVVGAGAILFLPDPSADAKFIGVESKGLEEARMALENDRKQAESMGLALLTSGNQAESEDTLNTRVTARTASLASIVRTAGAGITQQLRWAAEWAGADPDEVKVQPNLDFIQDLLSVAEVQGLWNLKRAGFPISIESIHALAQKGELTEKTLDEELEAIAQEPPLDPIDPNVGEEDDDQDDEDEDDDENAGNRGNG